MFAGEAVEDNRQHHADGGIEKTEKYQAGVNGDVIHPKGGKQPAVANEQGQDKKQDARLQNRCAHHFIDVPQFVMSHLVGEDGHDLTGR